DHDKPPATAGGALRASISRLQRLLVVLLSGVFGLALVAGALDGPWTAPHRRGTYHGRVHADRRSRTGVATLYGRPVRRGEVPATSGGSRRVAYLGRGPGTAAPDRWRVHVPTPRPSAVPDRPVAQSAAATR